MTRVAFTPNRTPLSWTRRGAMGRRSSKQSSRSLTVKDHSSFCVFIKNTLNNNGTYPPNVEELPLALSSALQGGYVYGLWSASYCDFLKSCSWVADISSASALSRTSLALLREDSASETFPRAVRTAFFEKANVEKTVCVTTWPCGVFEISHQS